MGNKFVQHIDFVEVKVRLTNTSVSLSLLQILRYYTGIFMNFRSVFTREDTSSLPVPVNKVQWIRG